MKKILAYVMCLVLILSFTGCGAKTESAKSSGDASAEATTESADETSATATDENMILNGDFSDGTTGKWNTYTNGGNATLSVKGGEMAIHITNPGTLDYAVQAYYDGFALDSGCDYEFSFDVHSDVARTGEWRIQINGSDYHAYTSDKIDITEDTVRIDTVFTMEEASDPAPRLCLNLGMVEGCPSDLGDHTVYVDNFDLHLVSDANKVAEAEEVETPDINLNQVGYLTNDTKKAVVRGADSYAGEKFTVVNTDTNETVYEGDLTDEQDNGSSAEHVAIADFSSVTAAGTYKIVTENHGESYSFVIGDNVYADVLKDTVKMYYMQRCGQELTAEYAGDYAHAACHTGEATIYGTSDKVTITGGWHDAGDYGRYVVAGAKAAYDLLDAYENDPSAFTDDYGLPYSGNGVPDILDEVQYELDWMLQMQTKDGGVYHKITTKNFAETVMPDQVTEELVVMPVSNTATGAFAAVMAKASTVYASIDSKSAKTYLKAAKKSAKYAKNHTGDPGYENPDDVATGEYPDSNSKDEAFWALAELYKATGDSSYQDDLKNINIKSCSGGFGWASTGYYGAFTYLTCKNLDSSLEAEVKDYLEYAKSNIVENADDDAYDSTSGDTYCWGSNLTLMNNALFMEKYAAIFGDGDGKYTSIAKEQINYVLGKNSNSYCFVTGYGTLSPENPHHRPSQVVGKAMTGMLIGGADSNLEDPYAKATLADKPAAKCYVDNVQSYSCNEITIYWNSAFINALTGCTK